MMYNYWGRALRILFLCRGSPRGVPAQRLFSRFLVGSYGSIRFYDLFELWKRLVELLFVESPQFEYCNKPLIINQCHLSVRGRARFVFEKNRLLLFCGETGLIGNSRCFL